jgi:hypothetical protein
MATAHSDLIVGQTYRIEHQRKGTFTGRITAVRGTWVDVVIVAGVVEYLANDDRGPGDSVGFTTSLATFTRLPSPEEMEAGK